MPTTVRWQEGTLFEVQARGHRLLCDQPKEDGGQDRGPEPLELLDASLGTCIGVYLAKNLALHGIPADGLEVEVAREIIKERPRRVGAFKVVIRLPAEVDERRRKALVRVAESCTVHHTFEHSAHVQVELETGGGSTD